MKRIEHLRTLNIMISSTIKLNINQGIKRHKSCNNILLEKNKKYILGINRHKSLNNLKLYIPLMLKLLKIKSFNQINKV